MISTGKLFDAMYTFVDADVDRVTFPPKAKRRMRIADLSTPDDRLTDDLQYEWVLY